MSSRGSRLPSRSTCLPEEMPWEEPAPCVLTDSPLRSNAPPVKDQAYSARGIGRLSPTCQRSSPRPVDPAFAETVISGQRSRHNRSEQAPCLPYRILLCRSVGSSLAPLRGVAPSQWTFSLFRLAWC